MTEPFVPSEEEDVQDSPEGGEDTERDDLIKAAQGALVGKTEEEKPKTPIEAERDEKGRFLKPPKPLDVPKTGKEAPKDDKPSSVIARELAKREARREEESGYKAKMQEAEAFLSKAQNAWSSIEAREQRVVERERQAEEFLANMQRDPMAAMQRVGWTAEDFINNATRSKDPGYQEAIALRQELSKRDSVIGTLEGRLAALEGKAKSYDEAGSKQQAESEIKDFWASIPQDSPMFDDYDDQDEIIWKARKVRQEFDNRTGRVASPQQVGEYLHYRALKKREVAPAESAGQKPKAGESKAKVPRALGSSEASERRSNGASKHVHDMSPAEERDFLMDIAANAVAGD
jgi:hypothetical protein